jgi:hypothetical protein
MPLSSQHIGTLNALADRIVPPDLDSPGAVAAGAAAGLLALLNADLAPIANDYTLFLAQVDTEAQVVHGRPFAKLDAEKQDLLLNTFQASAFFRVVVEHVQEQYWVTDAGKVLVGFGRA